MTEDRLKSLLVEANDLAPSAALRARVADLRPRPRTPWFALSGVSAALAVLALLAVPRESFAEGLLRRAAQNEARRSARFRAYSYVDGGWRLDRSGIVAGGWTRTDERNGGVQLDTPEASFRRSGGDGPIYRSQTSVSEDDGFTLTEHLRALRRLGRKFTVSTGPERRVGTRRLQDVTILMEGRDERETVTLDLQTELPVRIFEEARLKRGWTPSSDVEIAYPGPRPGSAEFWAGIDRRQVVGTDELARFWTRRLRPVVQTLRLSEGAVLKVRDLRILPTGDVLMLYTGPGRLRARLVGEDGTRYGRHWFDPNDGRAVPRSRLPIVLDGEPLRGFWFVPLQDGAPAKGRVRLELVGDGAPSPELAVDVDAPPGDAAGQRGAFTLLPDKEAADVPAWADAIDYGYLRDIRGGQDDVRLIAAYDRWLDGDGRSVEGTFWLEPTAGAWLPPGPPHPGLRHDPEASAAAARAFRTMMDHAKARGREINPQLVEGYLARFEREARSE